MIARIVLIGLAAVALAGCGGDGDDHRTVVAAFYPLAFAAEQVADPDTDVVNLTPAGAEPHDLELSARDVGRIADADLVLYLGGGFQPALEDALDSTGANGVDVLNGLDLRTDGAERDPHVWLDPVRFAQLVRSLAAALGGDGREETLARELELLHGEFERGLRRCARRELVTSHAAFGYLADRYGLVQVPIAGIAPEAEPTPGRLGDLVETVRAHGATTIFFETLVSPRLARTVAREVGATVAVLNPLEGLSRDELARGDDYFSVMRANLAALRGALGCH